MQRLKMLMLVAVLGVAFGAFADDDGGGPLGSGTESDRTGIIGSGAGRTTTTNGGAIIVSGGRTRRGGRRLHGQRRWP